MSKALNPYFTVVIPTHNRAVLLKRAILSVLYQTFENFEIIVIDDHSTDETFSVVNSFSDERIRYFVNDRTQGAGGARNVGIFCAKGKWVAFLDDDDIWLSEKLKYQNELIQDANRSIGLVCTDYAVYKGGGKRPIIIKNRPSGWIMEKLLYGGCMGCLSSMCIRADLLMTIGGFDEKFASNQDWDLWLRVAQLSAVTHVPKTLVIMFQDDRDRIGTNAEAKLAGHLRFRKKYRNLINPMPRIRHRFESFIFTYAFLLKETSLVLKCLPWVLVGALIDAPNFFRTISTTLLLYHRKTMRAKK